MKASFSFTSLVRWYLRLSVIVWVDFFFSTAKVVCFLYERHVEHSPRQNRGKKRNIKSLEKRWCDESEKSRNGTGAKFKETGHCEWDKNKTKFDL